jgi:hypothetical protein
MEKPTFARACLSNIRAIMVIMHVPLVEQLCQTVMGWIQVFECLSPGARECLRSYPVMLGVDAVISHGPNPISLSRCQMPPGTAVGGLGMPPAGLQRGFIVGRQVVKSYQSAPIMMRWGSRSFLDLILFKQVTPPLQPGEVGPYPVRGAWFPSACHWREPMSCN